MRVLVIGGTLFIGRLLVEELLKDGHEVAVLHRQPKHDWGRRVENIMADRNDADSVREALSTRRFDVVFDNVYDWERGTTAAQVEATVRACGDRLSRYIFMSSVAAYGDGLNHKESDPLAPDYHPEPYVRHKATTERLLFRMHAKTGLPAVEQLREMVVKSSNGDLVRMRDIANVSLDARSKEASVAMNGRDAVFVAVNATPSGNPLNIVDAIHKMMPDLEKNLPPALQMKILYESTKFINSSIEEVTKTLTEAIGIVIVVIFLFLGSFRTVLIPIVTIPLSIIGAVGAPGVHQVRGQMTLLEVLSSAGGVRTDAGPVVRGLFHSPERGLKPGAV